MARSTAQLARTAKNPEEIDAALTVLAYYGGNAARAAQDLGNVSERTLRDWRNHAHRDRYLQIAEREGPRIEALAAAQACEIVIRSADVEHRILDRLTTDDIDPDTGESLALTTKELSELSGALQRVATAKGINTTKLLELTGRPTSIVEHRDPTETVNALARRLGIAIDSTAVEIHPSTISQPLLPGSAETNAREPRPAVESPSSSTSAD